MPTPPLPQGEEVRGDSNAAEFKYVDDTTLTERISQTNVIRHISGLNPTEEVWAERLETAMEAIIERTGEIGMKVNCAKTQLLCVSTDNGFATTAKIRMQGNTVRSTSQMKLLGFMLSPGGDMACQIDYIKKKFRAKFWTIIHLRRAGIRGNQLYRLYAALIRPVLETNCVIFHSMLTGTQSDDLERLQKLALRVCFGTSRSYAALLAAWNIKTLKQRRADMLRKFTAKAMANNRFSEKWFVQRAEVDQDIRRRRPFQERKARTSRYYNSPLLTMQRIANDIRTQG